MSEAQNPSPGPGVVSLNIKERQGLYSAYMPLLKGGGVFFPTTRQYRLGDEVFMLLTLLDDPAKFPVAGRVVWITPEGAQSNKMQGVGVQFNRDESGVAARKKIESLLGGTTPTRPTHTI